MDENSFGVEEWVVMECAPVQRSELRATMPDERPNAARQFLLSFLHVYTR
jgi:hypothetical protein